MYLSPQQKISYYLDKNNLSVYEAEKRAGLKVNVVRNIISGKSKNPSLETAYKLSKTLGCSIYDLISEDHESPTVVKSVHVSNESLVHDSIDYCLDFLKKNNDFINSFDLFSLANQIYNYSITNNLDTIDEKFANWLLENDPGKK